MTAQAGAVAAWRELFTQADIDAAVKAGDRIEYTAFKSDAIDLPCSDHPGSEGWIRVRNPTVGDANHGRVRALTTQAGAVGWIVRRKDGAGGPIFTSNAADLPPWLADPRYEAAPLYTAPPAAVPVEALEGLVADWRQHAKMLRGEIRRPFGAVIGFMAACDADQAADELTQLIKERSNGR